MSTMRASFGLILAGMLGCSAQRPSEPRNAAAETGEGEPVTETEEGGPVTETEGEPVTDTGDAASAREPPESMVDADNCSDAQPPPPETDAAVEDSGTSAARCEALLLSATPVVPEVMIVLDRSSSMMQVVPDGVSCVGFDVDTAVINCLTTRLNALAFRPAKPSIAPRLPTRAASYVEARFVALD